ncbi:MAG: malate/lactate/ureidoglycolate dehydrogenase [Alphaproteobacteria bacterium]|nr:malate/lactate/ureidoglycolate dehydrogenase [Alphaproteobacteria bacterium]MCZ6840092.1 malate/lactate/ureidoglycolate dehydrogenase [Alphaproteobacteria bacterium]
MSDDVIITADALRALTYEIIRHGGSEAAECQIVSDHLVDANLSGHDSHGVGIVPTYVINLQKNMLRPNTGVTNVRDDGAFLQFDGGKGYGQRVAGEAMSAAIERCRETGIVVATLKNAHHIGRVGAYGEMATAAGMISLHFVNVTDHFTIVAPHRGTDSRFGTNPVCIAMPTGNPAEPIILDMATSKVAMGKLRVADNAGRRLPDGIVIDADGAPSNDPGVMFREPRGALLPFAEHKGYGLALMAELLSGTLSGGGTIQPANERLDGIINTMTVIVLDPARLGDVGWILGEVDAMAAFAKASPPTDPDLPVLVPGEPERLSRAERNANGVPLDRESWQQLLRAGETLGLGRAEALAIAGVD